MMRQPDTMELRTLGAMVALLSAIATGCDGYSTAPIPPDPPVQHGLWTVSGSPPAILRLAPAVLERGLLAQPERASPQLKCEHSGDRPCEVCG